MKFRVARHAKNLNELEYFYTHIVGLENLGGFKNHSGYDGLFLGIPKADWHLEFTISNEEPKSIFDEDDILVFYLNTMEDLEAIKLKVEKRISNSKCQKIRIGKKMG